MEEGGKNKQDGGLMGGGRNNKNNETGGGREQQNNKIGRMGREELKATITKILGCMGEEGTIRNNEIGGREQK